MRERMTRSIAWTSWALAVLGCVLGAVLLLRPAYDAGRWGFAGSEGVIALATASIAAVLCLRRPGNPVGWMLLLGGVLYAVAFVADAYARASLATGLPGAYPGTAWSAWLGNLAWVPAVAAMFTGLLFFPDGRLPSPRWRPVLAACLALTGSFAIGVALATGPLTTVPAVVNPAAIAPWSSAQAYSPLTFGALLLPAASAIALSLVVRFRRSVGVERAQLKWLVYVTCLTSLGTVPIWATSGIAGVVQAVGIAALPIAVGIAVMRYRLYEIDLIINRTIVYLAMSGILAAIYAVSTTVLERGFAALIGGDQEAGTVLTTLVIVALFTPLKTLVQARVDRRWKTPEHAAAPVSAGTPGDDLDAIGRLAALHRDGALTEAEFAAKKAELLARI